MPSVIASTPPANSASAVFGVIPRPPATFSPLTTTNVGCEALAQDRQALQQRAPADAADEVADEQDARACASAILCAMAGEADERHLRGATPAAASPSGRSASCGQPTIAPPSLPRHREPPRVVVPRWVQLVLLPIALLALWALAKAAGKVLLIFIVAALIALILNPAVAFLQRRGFPAGWRC